MLVLVDVTRVGALGASGFCAEYRTMTVPAPKPTSFSPTTLKEYCRPVVSPVAVKNSLEIIASLEVGSATFPSS